MLGLVLEGGGVKGSFQVGAVKALAERGYVFDGVTGTSIGAINGAMIAQGDLQRLEELWRSVKPSDVMEVEDEMIKKYTEKDFNKDVLLYFSKLVYKAVKNKGLSMERAENLLSKYIDEDKLRRSKTDFGLVTVGVGISEKFKPVELFKDDIPRGELLKYIIASAYFPAFRREPIDGKHYIDGGVYDNMPINPLVRKGYDKIIAIRTMSNMPHQKVTDLNVDVKYIIPSEKLGGTLAFTKELVAHNITLGYYDALKMLDGLVGRMYYTKPLPDASFRESLCELPLSVFRTWSAVLGITGSKEQMVNKVADLIREVKGPCKTVQEAFLVIMEDFAAAYELERFTIRTQSEFFGEISRKYSELWDKIPRPTADFKLGLIMQAILNLQ